MQNEVKGVKMTKRYKATWRDAQWPDTEAKTIPMKNIMSTKRSRNDHKETHKVYKGTQITSMRRQFSTKRRKMTKERRTTKKKAHWGGEISRGDAEWSKILLWFKPTKPTGSSLKHLKHPLKSTMIIHSLFLVLFITSSQANCLHSESHQTSFWSRS